jgi:hypothetical protein
MYFGYRFVISKKGPFYAKQGIRLLMNCCTKFILTGFCRFCNMSFAFMVQMRGFSQINPNKKPESSFENPGNNYIICGLPAQ